MGGKRTLAFVDYWLRMSVEHPQSQNTSYDVPKWARILSWSVPLFVCSGLIWAREATWTKGTVCGLALSFSFGFMWIRMAVRLGRGEPIPSFLRKPMIGEAMPSSWFDGRAGNFFQVTVILAASAGLALFW